MDKKKVLFSIGATIVLVGIIVAITVYTVKNREQTNIKTGSGGVVEMGISEEKSNIIDFSGYTILVYGDKSNVTDTYLSEVIRGVEAIQSAFEEQFIPLLEGDTYEQRCNRLLERHREHRGHGQLYCGRGKRGRS